MKRTVKMSLLIGRFQYFLPEASKLKISLFQKGYERIFRVFSGYISKKYLMELFFAKGQQFRNCLVKH